MKHMTLKEITAACGGTYFGDESSAQREVSSVVIDSRKVEKDSLFVAIREQKQTDIHLFRKLFRRALFVRFPKKLSAMWISLIFWSIPARRLSKILPNTTAEV